MPIRTQKDVEEMLGKLEDSTELYDVYRTLRLEYEA